MQEQIPALLTNMSSLPNFSMTFFTNSCAVSALLMSPATPIKISLLPCSSKRTEHFPGGLTYGICRILQTVTGSQPYNLDNKQSSGTR